MITLITGQPGAGKTLFALFQVKTLSDKENRPVYYSGINDLKLPWLQLEDAGDWHKCPVGSIIVIDECQRAFRPRGNGTQVPESVAKFETHRHQGHDVYLITQHPMLLDSNVRRLVGRHCHVVRAFGAKGANIHEWGEVREQCDKSRSGSLETLWRYPREVFGWYHSAEVHTHRLRIPPRFFFLLLMPFLLAGISYGLYGWWKAHRDGQTVKDGVAAVATASGATTAPGQVKDKIAYLEERTPRIAGLPHTAPVYDNVTTPTEAPIPVGCLQTETRCRCIDQQGVDYATDEATCSHIVKHGIFISWKRTTENAKKDDDQRRANFDPQSPADLQPKSVGSGAGA